MKSYKIAVIAGDGIGPEVISEGVRVLECVSKLDGGFAFWLGHSSLRSSLCERSDAELGSHFASKVMGACSREPRAKIFAQRANILVPSKFFFTSQ